MAEPSNERPSSVPAGGESMTKVVLVNATDDFFLQLSGAVRPNSVAVSQLSTGEGNAGQAAQRILTHQPDIVLVEVGSETQSALNIVEEIDRARPGLWSILIAEPEAEMWQLALRFGARDLLSPNASQDEIGEAVERAIERLKTRPPAPASADTAASPPEGGRVVTVISPKGGCGKTMMATNLAYGLHTAGRGQVVVVDFDLQFGDVAGALGLRPEYSVRNAAQKATDPTAAKSFLTSHPSGLFALCAPANPAEADSIEPKHLRQLLETLQADFDWVIVDTSAGVSEANLLAIEASTDVVVVATTDLAAIQAMRKAVVVLDQIGLTDHRRWYMLNRANARVGLDQTDIERSIGLAIDGTIPSARAVPISMNQGVTVLEDDPKSPAARSIRDFLAKLAPHTGPHHGETRGWLQRRRS